MSSDSAKWETVPLPEVLDFREGPGIMARDFRRHGVPLLRLAGLKQGASLLERCNYLDTEMVERRWAHFRVQPGDVLLSTSASLGEVAVVDNSAAGAIPYTGIIRFRPLNHRILQEFIRYALVAPSFRRQIEAMGVGSVLRHFGPMHLRQMTLDVPPLPEQRAIAVVLGALDDKIGANAQVIRLSAKLAGARFSEAAHDVVTLSDVAAITMGQSPPGDTYNESADGSPFYQGTRDFGFWHPKHRIWCTAPTRFAKSWDVLVSVRAPVGTVNVATETCAIGRGLAAIRSPTCPNILHQALAASDAVWAPYEAEGTVFGSINKAQLEAIRVPWPTSDKERQLEDVLGALHQRILSAEHESRALEALRDALLSHLLSGDLQVRDAEELAREAI